MNRHCEAALSLAGAIHMILDTRGTRPAEESLNLLAMQYERYGRPGARDFDPDAVQLPEVTT